MNDDKVLITFARPSVAELRTNLVWVVGEPSATPFRTMIAGELPVGRGN